MLRQMIAKFNFYIEKHFGEGASIFTKTKHAILGVIDFIIYGSTVTDYFELTFYKKSSFEKRKYMTFRDSNRFSKAFDDLDEGWKLSQKTELSTWVGKYFKREQISTAEMSFAEFESFCDRHPTFLFKPSGGSCGIGIEIIKVSEITDFHKVYESLRAKDGVLDEYIVQHRSMEELHPQSLNTLRVVSVRIGTKVNIAAAVLRMGNEGSSIDNYSAGGIVAPVDIKSGLVTAAAEDIYGKRYVFHPYTGAQIVGFNVPSWGKVIDLVRAAAADAPLSYIGWDVAVRQDDCVIVEANYRPMINAVQAADGGGKKEQFDSYIEQLKKERLKK